MTRELRLGLLGLGNVGGAVVRLIALRGAEIERREGVTLKIVRAAARRPERHAGLDLPAGSVGTDALAVVRAPEVDAVVELLGGAEPAGSLVLEALSRGKPVVTANKLLLAERGEALFEEAARRGVALRFEAAVCGGLPIVRVLREALAADRVTACFGILNGTTNFILGRMADGGGTLAEALAEAQALGYAEADPSLDLGGGDVAQKLCLLARLAFGARVRPSEIPTEGILAVSPIDLAAARELGCVVKLLAVARLDGERLDLRVHPAMVPAKGPLAAVLGAHNAVLVQSRSLGSSLFSAAGAGGEATATAVVADLIDLGRQADSGHRSGASAPLGFAAEREWPRVPREAIVSAYYLRFTVDDAPGVLASLTAALGQRGISIAALHQRERREAGGGPVAVVLLTHRAREGDVQAAVQAIDALTTTRAPTRLLRVETEAPLG